MIRHGRGPYCCCECFVATCFSDGASSRSRRESSFLLGVVYCVPPAPMKTNKSDLLASLAGGVADVEEPIAVNSLVQSGLLSADQQHDPYRRRYL